MDKRFQRQINEQETIHQFKDSTPLPSSSWQYQDYLPGSSTTLKGVLGVVGTGVIAWLLRKTISSQLPSMLRNYRKESSSDREMQSFGNGNKYRGLDDDKSRSTENKVPNQGDDKFEDPMSEDTDTNRDDLDNTRTEEHTEISQNHGNLPFGRIGGDILHPSLDIYSTTATVFVPPHLPEMVSPENPMQQFVAAQDGTLPTIIEPQGALDQGLLGTASPQEDITLIESYAQQLEIYAQWLNSIIPHGTFSDLLSLAGDDGSDNPPAIISSLVCISAYTTYMVNHATEDVAEQLTMFNSQINDLLKKLGIQSVTDSQDFVNTLDDLELGADLQSFKDYVHQQFKTISTEISRLSEMSHTISDKSHFSAIQQSIVSAINGYSTTLLGISNTLTTVLCNQSDELTTAIVNVVNNLNSMLTHVQHYHSLLQHENEQNASTVTDVLGSLENFQGIISSTLEILGHSSTNSEGVPGGEYEFADFAQNISNLFGNIQSIVDPLSDEHKSLLLGLGNREASLMDWNHSILMQQQELENERQKLNEQRRLQQEELENERQKLNEQRRLQQEELENERKKLQEALDAMGQKLDEQRADLEIGPLVATIRGLLVIYGNDVIKRLKDLLLMQVEHLNGVSVQGVITEIDALMTTIDNAGGGRFDTARALVGIFRSIKHVHDNLSDKGADITTLDCGEVQEETIESSLVQLAQSILLHLADSTMTQLNQLNQSLNGPDAPLLDHSSMEDVITQINNLNTNSITTIVGQIANVYSAISSIQSTMENSMTTNSLAQLNQLHDDSTSSHSSVDDVYSAISSIQSTMENSMTTNSLAQLNQLHDDSTSSHSSVDDIIPDAANNAAMESLEGGVLHTTNGFMATIVYNPEEATPLPYPDAASTTYTTDLPADLSHTSTIIEEID